MTDSPSRWRRVREQQSNGVIGAAGQSPAVPGKTN
jgi:hypothetical protein